MVAKNLINESTPACVGMVDQGYVRITISLKKQSGTRGPTHRYLYKLNAPLVQTNLVTATSVSYTTPEVTALDAKAVYIEEKGTIMAVPIGDLITKRWLIPYPVLFNGLNNAILTRHRNLISPAYIFRRITFEYYTSAPSVGGMPTITNNAPLASLRRYETHEFTFASGITGLRPGQEYSGGISYSLYPSSRQQSSSSTKIPKTSTVDRPSRYLVRGSTVPPGEVFTTGGVLELAISLNSDISLSNTFNVRLEPVIEVLDDIVGIRSVQCVGYVKVAGESGVRPGSPVLDEGGTV